MTEPKNTRRVEMKDDEDRTAAVAEVTTAAGPEGTVRASMYPKSEHVRPGDRAALVDEVMDLPEVQASDRMEATVPKGDVESVERLTERTEDAALRAAGGTTLVDANVPQHDDEHDARLGTAVQLTHDRQRRTPSLHSKPRALPRPGQRSVA